jgi:uncharacterized RDD family membrane protein YckC
LIHIVIFVEPSKLLVTVKRVLSQSKVRQPEPFSNSEIHGVDMAQTSSETPELIGCMNLDRFFAAQIDNLPAVILALIAGARFGSFDPIITWTAVVVAYFGYYLLSETLFGNTFGKWSMGLCIRTLNGEKCTVGKAVIRSLLRLVEVNPVVLGALPAGTAMFFSKRRQRFGDMLAGTVVLRRRP